MENYAEVILDITNRRLDRTYHYLIPEGLDIRQGMRVLVPLQGRQVQALVVAVSAALPEEVGDKRIRTVLQILDKGAIPQEIVKLARWLSETTICSVAQSLHTVWPLLKGKVEDWVLPLASPEDPDVQALKWLDPEAYARLQVLFRSRRKALAVPVFLARAGAGKSELEQFVAQGWVKLEARFASQWQGKTSVSGQGALASQKVQREESSGAGRAAELTSSLNQDPGSGSVLGSNPVLTLEQYQAVEDIGEALKTQEFHTLLLHGITGSGKTEVYRRAIRQVFQDGGDVILLVPEISLTEQLYRYLEEEFGSYTLILHSGLKPKEKAAAWTQMLTGGKCLVIGARSAVFAPLPNLRLIILDEEHDSAYKQDENPKYHARDVARWRMEQRGGVVLLGSATPSLEAYAAAQTGKIQLVTLKERVKKQVLPPVEIIDMREELAAGNRSIFSLSLQAKLRERLQRGEQSMLFLNRRGYSTFVVCRECGYVIRCPDCDVALTYHTHAEEMRCHYCSHMEKPPHQCPSCGSRYIRFFGLGTERVEEELRAMFPEIPLLRLDYDTTRLNGHQEILERFRRQEALVLIGTQMMAKGLDFPNVTLVGVIAADQSLQMPDFRARERTFQLLTQVAGRAGRSFKPGAVVIQTYAPEDRAILRASLHDFQGFFWEEIRYRKERLYPPFTNVIRVILQHEQEERVIKGAQELSAILRQRMLKPDDGHTELNVLGPAPAVLPRLKKQFRWQVSLKGKDIGIMRSVLHVSVGEFFQGPASSGIVLNIEVNPLNP
ncbi:MAG: primosomal protein N' [Desulfitobacteriaceae bacterium]|nr:primosomal protein N' [Desulfitobacteriaceae bacterium]